MLHYHDKIVYMETCHSYNNILFWRIQVASMFCSLRSLWGQIFFFSNYNLFVSVFQINELSHMTIPVMLLRDDFKAYSKLKVDNHLFNKLVFSQTLFFDCTQVCFLCFSLFSKLMTITFQGKYAQSLQSERILSISVP